MEVFGADRNWLRGFFLNQGGEGGNRLECPSQILKKKKKRKKKKKKTLVQGFTNEGPSQTNGSKAQNKAAH